MNPEQNIWFVNFNGIGNGIMISPLLKCFENTYKNTHYFHTNNEVLSNDWFKKKCGITNLIGLTPIEWRRFNKTNWSDINDFINNNNVRCVVNLRNEGPAYDTGYYAFKSIYSNEKLKFLDLNFDEIVSRKVQKNLVGDYVDLFAMIGVDMSTLNPHLLLIDSKKEYIGLGMAGSNSNKRWATSKWIRLAQLLTEIGKDLVLFPGKSEEELRAAKEVNESLNKRVEIVVNENLVKLTNKISTLSAFAGNDTGMLHIAAATGIPTVGIYTCTDPVIWSPFKKDNFIFFENKNFSKCPSRKVYSGNCVHYYDDCPAIVDHEDTINPDDLLSVIVKNTK